MSAAKRLLRNGLRRFRKASLTLPLLTAGVCMATLALLLSHALPLPPPTTTALATDPILDGRELGGMALALPEPAAGPPDPPAATSSDAPRAVDTAAAPDASCPGTIEDLDDVAADLVKRREALGQRESLLLVRETGLAEAARRLDGEAQRLETLRAGLEQQLQQLASMDQARIGQLVKLYESMKPKDAASVFDGLDLELLVSVVGAMREAKAAVIMAAMDPARAREVTTELAKRRAQPPLPTGTKPSAGAGSPTPTPANASTPPTAAAAPASGASKPSA